MKDSIVGADYRERERERAHACPHCSQEREHETSLQPKQLYSRMNHVLCVLYEKRQ